VAFFLEASFLGVLLFGRRLVPRCAHVFAAIMVDFDTLRRLDSPGEQLHADAPGFHHDVRCDRGSVNAARRTARRSPEALDYAHLKEARPRAVSCTALDGLAH
jgi:hypothetical protein